MKQLLLLLLIIFPTVVYGQLPDSSKYNLEAVVIRANNAIRVSSDTTSFLVDSFNKALFNNSTEDVLKHLPAVEVDAQGNITAQGKPVSKILINGKEYSTSDIRTITQNLPADVLEKIQIADWHDETEQFTGIKKEANQKIINLQFKKQYQQGVYGNANVGIGNKDRYRLGGIGNYMSQKLQLTGIGAINNTGINENSSVTSQASAPPGLSLNKTANLNWAYTASNTWQFNGGYEYLTSQTEVNNTVQRTTYLPADSLLFNNQSSQNINSNTGHNVKLKSKWACSKKMDVLTDVGFSYKNTASQMKAQDVNYFEPDTPVYRRDSRTNSEANTSGITFSNLVRRKFNKAGRSLVFGLQGNYSINNTNGVVLNEQVSGAENRTDKTAFNKAENSHNFNSGLNLQYTEPLSAKMLLNLKYAVSYTNNRQERNVWSDTGTVYYDSVQSRKTRNLNIEQPLGILLQYQNNKKVYSAGIDALIYDRTYSIGQVTVNQSGINFFPNLLFRYQVTKQTSLSVNYTGNITSPGINQLQSVPDYTDSLNVFKGNPNLRPELNHSLSFSYNKFETRTQRMMWLSVRANWVQQKIINEVDISSSKRVSIPVNADGVYNLTGSFNYSQPIVAKKLKAGCSMTATTGRNISITNGIEQAINTFNMQPGLRLQFTGKFCEADLNYSYRFNLVENSSSTINPLLQTHNLSVSSYFYLPGNFRLGSYASYVMNEGMSSGFDKNYLMVNASLDKTFKKWKGLSLRIQTFDIFNDYPSVQRTVGDNYFEDRSTNRLGSYFLCSVIYKFSHF